MHSITATDVNHALHCAIDLLLEEGVEESSRVGSVLVIPKPVCIEYTAPRNRVLFSETRDANHFFHVMEFLWFMSGSNELEFPVFFNSSYSQFSDDGNTMWDSYGWRWKEFFGYDQLEAIVVELKANPTSRRCVLAMWNASASDHEPYFEAKDGVRYRDDLGVACNGGKAVPCNTHAYFSVRDGKLNMTVMNRSNDLMWGALGANAVHFSFLLEYMAMRVGLPIGSYFQFTNNLHSYTERFSKEKLDVIASECAAVSSTYVELGPAITEGFDDDLKLFMPWALSVIRSVPPPTTWPVNDPTPKGTQLASDVPPCKTPFFHSVAIPMFLTWVYRKWKDEYSMNVCLDGIDAQDWQMACSEWIEGRKK